MKTEIRQDEPSVAELVEAWLVYANGQHGKYSYVARHAVENGEIGNQLPLTTQGLSSTLYALLQRETPAAAIWPHEVLMHDSMRERVVWMAPRGPTLTHFKCQEIGEKSAYVELPTLIFDQKGSTLRICAIKGNERPRDNTPVFHSTLFNVYDDGYVCTGQVKLLKPTTPKAILQNQTNLLAGVNTHQNGHEKKTKHKNGLYAMWKEALKSGEILESWLRPLDNLTLAKWLNQND
jgi:PRTRC genetic system protein B